jgi:ribosome-associated translation inhibitor RaiA
MLTNAMTIETQITTRNLVLSLRLRELIEKKMRAIYRFARDVCSAQIFVHRNAGIAPKKRFCARARLTFSQGEKIHIRYANSRLNVAIRRLTTMVALQARKRKRRRENIVRRIDKSSVCSRASSLWRSLKIRDQVEGKYGIPTIY